MTEKIFNNLHVLDGAMSTELEKRGVATNNKLWTAKALIDDIEAIYEVHSAYLKAGAQMILTNTYQANVYAFERLGYSRKQAETLIAIGILVAKKARDDYELKTGKHAVVAATIGPYGAYLADGSEYKGDYLLNTAQYLDFHVSRLQTILKQDPDCLALETQPKLSEPLAILEWLKQKQSTLPVYVSFTLQDEKTLSDGTKLQEAVKKVASYPQVFAVGVNCVAPDLVEKVIKTIRQVTTKKIIVYPNLGSVYDPTTKTWQKSDNALPFTQLIAKWHTAGADIIGGCCTTTTEQIEQIAAYFKDEQKNK